MATTLLLALYLAYFGRISPVGLSLTLIVGLGVVLVAMFLWEAGFFDNMLLKFQYDYGSALSRDYALEILQSISSFACGSVFPSPSSTHFKVVLV
jgi:predicted membrane metal-binding protein